MTLDDLGPRLCIMGPSNSGKSTLAVAIARSRRLPAVHLDQLHHRPNTNWQPRPDDEFVALHDNAIAGPRWVMDGNYSRCLPHRLARATGVIILGTPTHTSLLRYVRRSWFERARHGALDGGSDTVTWAMIRHIAVTTPANRRRYAMLFDQILLSKLILSTTRELTAFYRAEGLER